MPIRAELSSPSRFDGAGARRADSQHNSTIATRGARFNQRGAASPGKNGLTCAAKTALHSSACPHAVFIARSSRATRRVGGDPRRGTASGPHPTRRQDPKQPGSSTQPEPIGGAPAHRGSRRGPRPSCAGRRPDPFHALAAGETDASPENVAAVRSHRAHSTACSNAYAERLIGSLRRECLDHIVVLGEIHLLRILAGYFRMLQPGALPPFTDGRCAGAQAGAGTRTRQGVPAENLIRTKSVEPQRLARVASEGCGA